MKQIIINADDFGANDIVTSEIEKVIVERAVSSTTVMANGLCLDEVRRFAAEHPKVSFGVHLCLSEFSSLTKSEVLHRAGLTDENGQFVHKAVFRLQNLNEEMVQNAIRDELNAQIDVVSSLGFPISHADSHHHVHTIYALHEVFSDVLHNRGIKKMRLCMGFKTLRSKAHLLNYLRHVRLNHYYRSQFTTADIFTNYASFVNKGKRLHDGQVVELMCHPGHPADRYQKEMQLVENKCALQESDVRLISYNDLQKN